MTSSVFLWSILFLSLQLSLNGQRLSHSPNAVAHENSTNEISSEKYNVSLKCVPGEIQLTFNFAEKFRGIILASNSKHPSDIDSDCQLRGDGLRQYTMKIPLQKCGTVEDPERTFTNTVMLRYHPVLEIGGDETKTIVCKYGRVRFVFGNPALNEN